MAGTVPPRGRRVAKSPGRLQIAWQFGSKLEPAGGVSGEMASHPRDASCVAKRGHMSQPAVAVTERKASKLGAAPPKRLALGVCPRAKLRSGRWEAGGRFVPDLGQMVVVPGG